MFYVEMAALLLMSVSAGLSESGWTKAEEVNRGTELVVAYRAQLIGDTLVVEARHGKSWHTYAMDNPARAKQAGGNTDLGLELPTEISISGGLEAVGAWYQSKPLDLSDASIGWHTWGFSEVAWFATKVRRAEGDTADVTVSAQACSDSACRMVDRLTLRVEVPAELARDSFDLDGLEKVKPQPEE
jgi:hypothetical protein